MSDISITLSKEEWAIISDMIMVGIHADVLCPVILEATPDDKNIMAVVHKFRESAQQLSLNG